MASEELGIFLGRATGEQQLELVEIVYEVVVEVVGEEEELELDAVVMTIPLYQNAFVEKCN